MSRSIPFPSSHSVPVPVGKSIVERGLAELQKYATDTGGDTFYAAKQTELERLYSDVTEEARNQYTLTFNRMEWTRATTSIRSKCACGVLA